jgi:uncharacterized OB-fold protein
VSATASYLPAGMPRPVPEGDGLDRPYWEGTRAGRLLVQRCRGCRGFQWVETAPRGHVYSWERAWHPVHPALKDHGPYIVVLVELPEAGSVRMIGNLLGDPTQEVPIGAPVEAVFEPHDDATPPFTLVQWRRTAP